MRSSKEPRYFKGDGCAAKIHEAVDSDISFVVFVSLSSFFVFVCTWLIYAYRWDFVAGAVVIAFLGIIGAFTLSRSVYWIRGELFRAVREEMQLPGYGPGAQLTRYETRMRQRLTFRLATWLVQRKIAAWRRADELDNYEQELVGVVE